MLWKRKMHLENFVKKHKKEYDAKSAELCKMVNWNDKTKKHANHQPRVSWHVQYASFIQI